MQGDEWAGEGSLVWQAFQRRELFLDLVGGVRYHEISTEGGQFTGGDNGDVGFVVPRLTLVGRSPHHQLEPALRHRPRPRLHRRLARASCAISATTRSKDHFVLLHWGAYYNFFLEPLIDPAGWADPETPEDSTLAHEIALVLLRPVLVPAPGAELPADRRRSRHRARRASRPTLAADNQVLGRAEYRLHIPRLFMPDATPTALPLIGNFRTRPAHVFGLPDWDFIVQRLHRRRALVSDGRAGDGVAGDALEHRHGCRAASAAQLDRRSGRGTHASRRRQYRRR